MVNDKLKRLRLSARPPISGRAMAEALGVTSSAYHFYESAKGFKQRYLAVDFARRVAAILADRGVNPDDVLALAGVGLDESATPGLSAGEQQLVEAYRDLDPSNRALVLQLTAALGGRAPQPPKHA